MDNFVKTCPIATSDRVWQSELLAAIRSGKRTKIGHKEAAGYVAKVRECVCEEARRRWFYGGCSQAHLRVCRRFIYSCVEALTKQAANPENKIHWGPAYAAKIMADELNIRGEDVFKPLTVDRTRRTGPTAVGEVLRGTGG